MQYTCLLKNISIIGRLIVCLFMLMVCMNIMLFYADYYDIIKI